MLSKNNIKFINSLRIKKNRESQGKFVVEGEKITKELLNSDFEIDKLFATEKWIRGNVLDSARQIEIIEVDDQELKKISSLSTPNQSLAIVEIPSKKPGSLVFADDLAIVLQDIQDPGNMGTVLRTADWFGIKHVFCSDNCVDIYNEKVVQASMGAIFRVNTTYVDLVDFLSQHKHMPIIGTYPEGEDIYQAHLPKKGLIVFGNEAKGIGGDIDMLVGKKVCIPSFNKAENSTESLNIAMSVAIVCSEFKRRILEDNK